MSDQPLPRPAATLILARGSVGAPEILLLKRGLDARFMPGAYVYAGGAVDAGDTAPEIYAMSRRLDDPRASGLLGVPANGLGFYVAAVREAFEECGLLLVSDDTGKPVSLATWTEDELHRARVRMGAGESCLLDLCRLHGWSLALEQLHYFAHWVTPVGLRQRFDTRFFIARAPVHQEASLVGDEMSELIWRTPQAALRDHSRGRLLLMRATLETLRDMAAFRDIDALFAFASTPRKVTAVLPVIGTGTDNPIPGDAPNCGDAP